MADCGDIFLGSEADCDNLPSGGTAARIIILNFDDISSFEEDSDGKITDINLRSGKKAYEFLGFRDDVKYTEEVVKPEIGLSQFKHSAGLTVYDESQVQKNNIENLSRGRFVAIVENKGKDENSFEVVGKNIGMEIVPGSIRDAHENGGFFIINLATPDDLGEYETKLPQTLGTSYNNAVDIVDELLGEEESGEPGEEGVFDESFDFTFE